MPAIVSSTAPAGTIIQTARGLGYTGTAAGLLDPETNMTYAVKYLAGAYRVAGGNSNLAVHYYAAGYYYAAKGRHMLDTTTPKAERTLDKARKVGDEVALEALNGFSDAEATQLIALLQRVRGNLSRLVDR